ncbi:MAG: dTMP kinase [Candidatus Electrothrix aestuarii]|uniref:Thymidylate kinase n=1 Tax=Candidatus Electrothrix aestuarii TaxID=3062594 RepID=A0AAU8LVH9_9BACT|nr:dTMP kinase [Candidatus Electrothrix aestuarii]
MESGMLVAFEGIDGTGKSTQLQGLATFLKEQGFPLITTYEPTDSRYGRKIRELYKDRSSCTLEEELRLFIEDRRLHVDELIKPGLAAGNIILTDRYYYSTAAYQGAAGMDPSDIFARNSFAPMPNLVLLLTMDPEISIARIQEGRGEELNDFEQLDQLRKVADHFASFTDPCIVRIDAAQAPDQVQEDIRKTVQERLL